MRGRWLGYLLASLFILLTGFGGGAAAQEPQATVRPALVSSFVPERQLLLAPTEASET